MNNCSYVYYIIYSCFVKGGLKNFFDLSYWGYFVYMVLVAYHAGERCSPLRIIRASLLCRKIASLFADLRLLRDRKAVQVYASMLVLFDVWVLCAFWICSAPLSRLTPIEALPQAPLGALPPDPHNGFHPLTLTRGVPLDILLASLGVGAQLWSALPIPHSSFLIPNPSLFTPVFKLDKCLKKCYYTIVMKLICKFSVLSERK